MARRGRDRKNTLSAREKRRLIQLGVCVALFCAVFFGRGLLPQGLDTLRTALAADTDFQAAFAHLGRSLDELGQETFLAQPVTATPSPTPTPTPVPTPMPTPTPSPTPSPTPEPTPTPVPEPTSYPYDGPDAPANATMAYDALDITDTMLPVSGHVTDSYGWRIHPITGEDNFHHGTDLSSPEGTEILAFADGVVDFIGEGDSYGKYIQLRHSDQVTTLYAHCSELLRQKGEEVKKGDVIALVGQTGMTTGPHLHFEVRVDGVWHDPIYYLELP